jgi:hypothetical protein
MCPGTQLLSVAPVERHEEGRAMKRILMSLLAATIVAVGGSPTATGRPIDTSIVRPCPTSWPVPTDVIERASAAMLPTYPVEPTGYRSEASLSIIVGGVRRPVAAGIGIDADGARITPLHTEACDGSLHVSAPAPVDLHLWQLFEEWGVRLTRHCIGEVCDANGVRIELDGQDVSMCPGAISIEDGMRIELTVT